MSKTWQTILAILGIGIAYGAGTTQYDKGGLFYDGISTQKVVEKFALADNKIKSKYQLDGNELKIPAPDKNSVAISLGDKTKPEFEPKLEIKRWENETRFSIKPKGLDVIQRKDKDLTFEGDKIKFQAGDIEYHFYDAPTSSEEGGFEYEIVLNKYTGTSTFYSEIETQGLEFYKQLPLNVEMASSTCTETECGGSQRPVNVVNSYAVYHATQQGDYSKLGGYNYKAGKAFHIYRVKAVDADGQELWCDQNIYGNTHEISCDNNWLEKVAKYPVRIDPTFGYTSAGASNSSKTSDYIYSFEEASPTERGELTSITWYGRGNSGKDQYMKGAIYVSSTNALVATTSEYKTDDNGVSWHTFDFTTNPTISVISYNLCLWWDIYNASNYYDSNTSKHKALSTEYNGVFPATIIWGTTDYAFTRNGRWSVYATYEAASTVVQDVGIIEEE